MKNLKIKSTDSFLQACSKMILGLILFEINDSNLRKRVVIFIRDHFGIEAKCNKRNNPLNIIEKQKLVVDLKMEKNIRLVFG